LFKRRTRVFPERKTYGFGAFTARVSFRGSMRPLPSADGNAAIWLAHSSKL